MSIIQRILITPNGFSKLEKELKHLKVVERPNVIEAISSARSKGDLSENAEYHSAKEKQGFIEGKIAYLQNLHDKANIISYEEMKHQDSARFGATVILIKLEDNSNKKITIVSQYEADVENGFVSSMSPVAKSLMGKFIGDTIEIAGSEHAIIDINYDFLKK